MFILNRPKKKKKKKCGSRGFTLIELLIVIVIIGILALIIVMVLNPAEMLKKGRDSQRLSDLTTLKSAISLYLADVSSPSMGTAGNVYCSLPTTATDCGAGGACDTCDDTPYPVDGTGWIPINLTNISTGTPISNLPIDPVNSDDGIAAGTASATDYYYEYAVDANNFFEIDCALESTYYTSTNDVRTKDGGDDPNRYEVGTDSGLDLL